MTAQARPDKDTEWKRPMPPAMAAPPQRPNRVRVRMIRVTMASLHGVIHTFSVNRLCAHIQNLLARKAPHNKIRMLLLSFENGQRLKEPGTLPRVVELIEALASGGRGGADDSSATSNHRNELMVLDLGLAELELTVVTALIAAAGASLRGLVLGRSSGAETSRIAPTFQAIHPLADLQYLAFDNQRAAPGSLRPLFSHLEECKNLHRLALRLEADALHGHDDGEGDNDDYVDSFARALRALRVAGTLRSLTIENRGLPDSWLAPLAQAVRELQPNLFELTLIDSASVFAVPIRGHFDDEEGTSEPVVFQDNKQVWLCPERASLLYQGAEGMSATLDACWCGVDDGGGHATAAAAARLALTGRGALQGKAVTQLADSLPRMRHLTMLQITDYQEDQWTPEQQLQLLRGLQNNTSLTTFSVQRGSHSLGPIGVEPVLQRNRDLANVRQSFLANKNNKAALACALATLGQHELGETPALLLLRSQMGTLLEISVG